MVKFNKHSGAHPDTGIQTRNNSLRRLGYGNYREYLQSIHWSEIRQSVLRRYRTCRCCGSKADLVHHDRYDYATMAGLNTCHLVSLCRECHDHIEVMPTGQKTTTKQARRRLHNLVEQYREKGYDVPDAYPREQAPPDRAPVERPAWLVKKITEDRFKAVMKEYDACMAVGRKPSRRLRAMLKKAGIVLPRETNGRRGFKPKKKKKKTRVRRPKVIAPPPGPITYDELNRFMAWLATQPKPTGPPVFNQPPWQFEGEEPEKPKYRPLVEIRGVPAEPEPPKRVKKTPPPPHPDGNWRTRQAAKAAAWRLKHGIPEPDWGSEADTQVRSYWVCFTPDPPDAMPEPVAQTPSSPPSSRLLRMKQAAAGRTGSPVIFN